MTDTKAAHAADTSDMPEAAPPAARAYESEFAPVIRSKIQPPPLRSTTLTRQRLIDRLHEATQSRVTLLVAEAGYGKTTLLADFAARSGQRTLWYRLDPTDADSITWTNYLIAACRELDPMFGAATLRLLSHVKTGSPPKTAYVESLAGELASWSAAPTTLILDDFQHVDRFAEATEFVYRLIEGMPSWLHMVVSTRRRPALELARLAVAGDLAEIGVDELRFSEEETSRLFAEGYGRPLDDSLVHLIESRTRGWPASLALVYGSIRDKSYLETIALANDLSGATAPIYDFLAEEVLASVPEDLDTVLTRASILESLNVRTVVALFGATDKPPTPENVRGWIEKSEGLGLLTRVSRTSDHRAMHPLLRDFMSVRLKERFAAGDIRTMHRHAAEAMEETEPLSACSHYLEAGDLYKAMVLLESSILMTLGSGQWGAAGDLIDRLRGTQPGPGVAAILARKLMDEGDLTGAERTLSSVDSQAADAAVRSALRQTTLALGWRTGNRELVRRTAQALLEDSETARAVREIAQVFVDADLEAERPPTMTILAARLAHMSRTQASNGLDFFSAVSLHNSSVAYLAAGDFRSCIDAGLQALAGFSRLQFQAVEAMSTHSVIATAFWESGHEVEARQHINASMSDGREFADVPATIAVAYTSAGLVDEAMALISRARALEKQGRSDVAGSEAADIADAFTLLVKSPVNAIDLLAREQSRSSFDLGHRLERRVMLAHAYLAAGIDNRCLEVATEGLDEARRRGARRSEWRLAVLAALASDNKEQLSAAIREAHSASKLSLPELADVLSERLELAEDFMGELEASIRSYPLRWLPRLREVLGKGAPAGRLAANLLDQFGELKDVGVLRAYARTYRTRGASQQLGLALARRTSPRLHIHDLGRVILEIGQRSIAVSGMRRKPAAILMYLASRSSFTAHRDQIIDDIWPDADPASALNSLNQSLYFLRREIDPWYEDGVSPEYIAFAGDLLWLDEDLVRSDSAEFFAAANRWRQTGQGDLLDLLRSYMGHFAPEFEYEEWALSFRAKLKSKFLETATSAVARLIRGGEFEEARGVAVLVLEMDDSASDIERTLVWLHWRLGAKSAAKAQFEHLVRLDQLDGLDSEPLDGLVNGPPPIGT